MKKTHLILVLLFAFAVLTCTSGVASAATVEEGHVDSIDVKDKPVFLFFYNDWCHFCQEQKQIIDELEQEYADKINFIRINGEENPQMTEEFGVTGFPAMFLITDKTEEGYVYQQFRGFTEKTELKDSITHALTYRDVRRCNTMDDHIRSLSPEAECPPGSYARNCGGCPCECECYNATDGTVVGYRSCKLGDVLVKDTTLTKDYTYTGSSGSPFDLDEDGITLDCKGHTLDGAGVAVSDNNRVTIKNCVIVNADYDGISLCSSSNNNITGNTVYNNSLNGILLHSSDYNTLTDNTAYNNPHYGILLADSSSYNTLTGNTCYENLNGIELRSSSSNNILTDNTAYYNAQHGIFLWTSSSNTLTSNIANNNPHYGISLCSSSNNNITGNFAYNNSLNGIFLYSSDYNTLTNNIAAKNTYEGVYLDSSSYNTLTGNTAYDNYAWHGIFLYSSDYNTIYNNYFNNAWDNGNNIWNIAKTSGTNLISGPYLGGNY